jgi:hypothetical protein
LEDRYSKYFVIVIILLFLVFSINLLPYFHIYEESISVPSDILEKHQGLISLVGIIAAMLIFWGTILKQETDRKNDLQKRFDIASELILEELRDIKEKLTNPHTISGQSTKFLNDYFNHDGYQSVLYSDLFTHFPKDTQNVIKKLYHYIRLHNEFLKQRYSLGSEYYLYYNSQEKIDRWNNTSNGIDVYLNQLESQIITLVDEAEKALNGRQ